MTFNASNATFAVDATNTTALNFAGVVLQRLCPGNSDDAIFEATKDHMNPSISFDGVRRRGRSVGPSSDPKTGIVAVRCEWRRARGLRRRLCVLASVLRYQIQRVQKDQRQDTADIGGTG